MKKFLTCLLSSLLAVLCLFTCVGCNVKPVLDINKADTALREKGYEVEIEYGGDFGEFSDIEGVIAKSLYAEKGEMYIEIYEFENRATAKQAYKMLRTIYENSVSMVQSYIDFYEHILEEYDMEMTSEEIDEVEDQLKLYRKQLKEAEEELESFGCSGKFIWFASDVDVIKDAK